MLFCNWSLIVKHSIALSLQIFGNVSLNLKRGNAHFLRLHVRARTHTDKHMHTRTHTHYLLVLRRSPVQDQLMSNYLIWIFKPFLCSAFLYIRGANADTHTHTHAHKDKHRHTKHHVSSQPSNSNTLSFYASNMALTSWLLCFIQ